MQRAGAPVEPSGGVDIGAEEEGKAIAREQFDRRPARAPLAGACENCLRRRSRVRRLDPATLLSGAIDAVLRDHREDAIGRFAHQPDQRFAAAATEARDEIIGIVLEPGNHLASVAAGCPMTDLACLEHDHRAARLGERERAG